MDVEKLICCIFNKPRLWDLSQEGHSNRLIVKKDWEEIAEEMNAPVELCRNKWRNLRDIYRKELKKYNKRLMDESCNSTTAIPKWNYFKHLRFLDVNLDKVVIENDESVEEFEQSLIKEEFFEDDLYLMNETTNTPEDIYEKNQTVAEKRKTASPHLHSNGTNKKSKVYLTKTEIDNSDYHFVMSLLPFLKEIPMNRKLFVRNKITNILAEEQKLDEQNPI